MSEHNGTPGSVPADIRTNPPLVMTPDEVVVFLSLESRESLQRFVRLERLPVVKKLGKEHRYVTQSVLRALEVLETPVGEDQSRAGERRAPNG